MLCGTIAEMRVAEACLAASEYGEKIELHRTEYPVKDLSILDILPQGCSKGIALKKVAAMQGISREEIMAIGDNFNDLEMLNFAGRPVVMANSAPGLVQIAQERGWEITATNDEDGVAQVMESVFATARVQYGERLSH